MSLPRISEHRHQHQGPPLAPTRPPWRGVGAPWLRTGALSTSPLPKQQRQPRGRASPSSSSPTAPVPAPSLESLSLTPEAVRVLQRRSLERRHQPGSLESGDWRALLRVSLLNEQHRYDDEEYEEEEEKEEGTEQALVSKCTEWLRGVERAASTARHPQDKLRSLPHLSTL